MKFPLTIFSYASRQQFGADSGLYSANTGYGLPHPLFGYRAPNHQQSVDMSTLTSGLPALSVSSSSSPSPMMSGGTGLYASQPGGLPYVLPSGDQLMNFDPHGIPYQSNPDPNQWNPDGTDDSGAQFGNTPSGYSADNDYDDSDRHSLAASTAPSLSVSSPNSMSPVSAPSPGDLSNYTTPSTMTMASGQWSNTPIITQGMPDPIEPFFKTLRERNLVNIFCYKI